MSLTPVASLNVGVASVSETNGMIVREIRFQSSLMEKGVTGWTLKTLREPNNAYSGRQRKISLASRNGIGN